MIKMIKEHINKRKQKNIEYWANLDLEREEKIEKIKKSRSERFMKDSKRLVFEALFLLIILLIVPIYMYISSHVDFKNVHDASAYAEEINISTVAYEDVVNDSFAVVSFNQIFNFESSYTSQSDGGASYSRVNNIYTLTGSNSSTAWLTTGMGISFVQNHVYYFYINTTDSSVNLNIEHNGSGIFTENHSLIHSFNNDYSSGNVVYLRFSSGSHSGILKFYIIDLTQMFGAGNEPNLEQAQELFVADYYVYDTGSAVSLSGLNAYAEGVQSVYDTLTYNYVGEDSYNLLQPYAFYRGSTYYNGAPSKEQSHISVASVDGDGWTSGNGFALYYPFTSSLVAGDTIVLNGMLGSATDLGSHQQATTYIIIRYGENIYDVLSVDNIVLQDATTNNINSFTYTLPSDATGLVFYSVQPFRIKDLTIQIKSLSINNLIDSAYKNGYDKGSNPYQVGNNGYNQIFEAGRLQGVEDAGNYTFLSLLTTAIDVPINSVLHMLDFDLLGMNMKSFYLSMFTFAIILFVIKLLI